MKYENSQSMVVLQLLPRKFAIRTWFCNGPQYLCLFHMVFECITSIHDQRKMLVLPNQLLCWVLSTSDQGFVSFQPMWCHPHTLIRLILFHGVRIKHSQFETFSQPYFNRFSQIAFPIEVLAKGWPYRFRSRGTTGSSILDHDYGHLCRGRRIQMSGHSDLWIFSNFRASSIFTWVLADTPSASCPSQPGNLNMISLTFAAVICDADDPCSLNAA